MDIRYRCVCPFDNTCLTYTTDWYETASRATMALAQHFLTEHNAAVVRMGRRQVTDTEPAWTPFP